MSVWIQTLSVSIQTSQHKRRRQFLALLLAAILASTVVTVVEQNTMLAPARATPTTALITAGSSSALAETVALADFPGGSSTVVIAQNSEDAVLLAANYASRLDAPLLVSDSGTDATDILPALAALESSEAVLVSASSAWFSPGFVTELTGISIAVIDTFDDADSFAGWVEAATSTAQSIFVLAHSDSHDEVNIATSLSFSLETPLVLWDDSTTDGALETFFADNDEADLIFVAQPGQVPYDLLSDYQVETLYELSTDDAEHAFAWAAAQAQAVGVSTSSLYVAPADSRAALAIAGLSANIHEALLAPAGDSSSLTSTSRADVWLNLWKSETVSLMLVGVGLTGTDLANVSAPTLSSHASPPLFRITDVTISGSSWTYSTSTVAGATSYIAYDLYGAPLATSSSPTFTLGEQANAVLVVAEDSVGELARIDVRMNDYADAGSRRSALVGSTSEGTNHIVFLSDIATPRIIARTVADPFAMDPSPSSAVPVGITCESTFTDTGLDSTKQYSYIVEELTNVDSHACDPLIPAAPAIEEERVVSQIPLPSTTFPWFRGDNAGFRGASPTISGNLISAAIASAESDSMARGDETPLFFRWLAYIPEEYVLFPDYSGDPARPFVSFGGDNRTIPDPNGSARFTQTIYMFFGTYHGIVYAETMGTTYKYKCGVLNGCVQIDSATAPLSELSQASGTVSTPTTGYSGGDASATIPLVEGAPAIDVIWRVNALTTGIYLLGYHDNMPKHQFIWGVYPGQAYLGYSSPYLSAAQLPCLFSSPSIPIPGCAVYFNIHL